MNNEPNFRDNSVEKDGVYQENRTTKIIFILAITIPFIGFIISFYGFGRAYRLGINLKLGVLGVVISFLEFLLFTFLFYLWILNGAKL